MLFSRIFIFGFILLFFKLCDETDPCLEKALDDPYEMPIYFNWLLELGTKKYNSGDPDVPAIPEELLNKTIIITFYKKHCGGQLSHPMTYQYVVNEKWIKKEGIGKWSINVLNEEEELIIDLKYKDEPVAASNKIPQSNFSFYINKNGNFVKDCYFCVNNGNIAFRDFQCNK